MFVTCWKIFIDGEEIEIYKALDALIAFDIEGSGEHTIEMRYIPDIYVTGMKISICGISVFIIICVLDMVLKKTKLIKTRSEKSHIYWTLEDFDEDHEQYLLAGAPFEKKRIRDIFKKIKKSKKENGEN